MTQLAKKQLIENQRFVTEACSLENEKNEADEADLILLRGSMLRDLIAGVKVVLGPGGNLTLEGTGTVVGANYAEYLLERGVQLDEAPRILSSLLNQSGWGKAEVEIDADGKTGMIRIENCVTARCTKTATPNCYFLKGYFKGVIGKLAKTEIECLETACMAKGDTACEFRIRKKQLRL